MKPSVDHITFHSQICSRDKMLINHLAGCMYPIPVPFQTCSSGKGTDMRIGIALPILSSGSRRKFVVCATPHSLILGKETWYTLQSSLKSLVNFIIQQGATCRIFYSAYRIMSNFQDSFPDYLVQANVLYG